MGVKSQQIQQGERKNFYQLQQSNKQNGTEEEDERKILQQESSVRYEKDCVTIFCLNRLLCQHKGSTTRQDIKKLSNLIKYICENQRHEKEQSTNRIVKCDRAGGDWCCFHWLPSPLMASKQTKLVSNSKEKNFFVSTLFFLMFLHVFLINMRVGKEILV